MGSALSPAPIHNKAHFTPLTTIPWRGSSILIPPIVMSAGILGNHYYWIRGKRWINNIATLVEKTGLAPTRRQTVIWTNGGVMSWCIYASLLLDGLTHWGRATHTCVSKLTIIGSDNGLSPGRHQAITWTNAGILLIGSLGTKFSENLIGIQTFSFKKMHLKISSAKWRPSCLGLNVLMIDHCDLIYSTTD